MNVDIKIECDTAEDFERIMQQMGKPKNDLILESQIEMLKTLKEISACSEVDSHHVESMDNNLKLIVKNQPKGGGLGYDPTIAV